MYDVMITPLLRQNYAVTTIWRNNDVINTACARHLTSHPIYRKVSNIRRTLVGNKIVDHSDVVGASPVGAAPTTSSFST